MFKSIYHNQLQIDYECSCIYSFGTDLFIIYWVWNTNTSEIKSTNDGRHVRSSIIAQYLSRNLAYGSIQ